MLRKHGTHGVHLFIFLSFMREEPSRTLLTYTANRHLELGGMPDWARAAGVRRSEPGGAAGNQGIQEKAAETEGTHLVSLFVFLFIFFFCALFSFEFSFLSLIMQGIITTTTTTIMPGGSGGSKI